jgi:outer membrane receptor protein involved in Fe transport
MKFRLSILTLFISFLSIAQKGTIKGTLTDADMNNAPLPFANALIKGTTNGVTTDENGNYSLSVEQGNYVVQFSFIGYENVEVPVTVKAGETLIINKSLGSGSYKLEDVVVKSSTVNREKETALLLEQKNAVEMKQAIGAQELSRKGVGDAAGAVSKTAGVSQQEGAKNVFVRGLGDRYNSTSLNGLPLPSEDPEYKNIALQFFTTDIIKNINVNKTFNSSLYGDVSGANIDIASKELDKSSLLTISLGNGFNSNALKTKDFLVADGTNYFGFLENGTSYPITNLNTYNFDTSFKPETRKNNLNSNISVSAGKKFKFGNKSLSIFGVVNSSSEYLFAEGKAGAVNGTGGILQDLDFKKYSYNANQTGLANIKYKFGTGKSISYSGLYIHDSKESVGDYVGFKPAINDDNDATNSFIRRQQTNNNILFSNQLLFDYKVTDKWDSNISVSYNTITASEPDRKTNSYDYKESLNSYVVATNSSSLNNRFFSTLDEKDLAGKIEATYTFNPNDDLQKKLVLGGNYRKTDRTFENTQFNYDFPLDTNTIDINNPDAVFNQNSLNNGVFTIRTSRGVGANAFNPYFYTGKRDIISGYAQFIYPVNEKFTVQVGVRNENVKQKVEWDTNLSSSSTLTVGPSIIDKNYILPSLLAKYSLNERNALRIAASQTYTYPQFKETAPFSYEDVNFTSFGNPDLIPSTNYNFDLKYDFYLSKNEIISFGTFYKLIKDPINRIRVASAGNDLSYVNLGDAYATGFEVEARKSIYKVEEGTRKRNFDFGLNLSYLYTNVKVIDNPNDRITIVGFKPNSKLEGASPLLINSDLSYSFSNDHNSLTSSLVFNYFQDKAFTIGTSNNENIIEKAVPTLDFINKFEFIKNKVGMNVAFKNILNPNIKLTQEISNGESTVGSYKKGFFASIGFYWNL